MPDPIKKSSWNIQQAKVKAEKDAKLKLLLQDKEFLNNLKEQSKSNKKINLKEVNLKPSDATKVVIKNRPEIVSKSARNKTDKEIAEERKAKIEESIKYQDVPMTSDNWREVLAKETQSTGDKFRVSLEPNFFDDYLNPASMIGNMASNLGQAPLQAQQSDSILPYITSVGTPLAVGALAGLGTQNTSQFVNNLVNPLAGTGDLINNLGNKYLPNAHKLNPFAFKPNPEAFYRQVGKSAYDDAITKGKVFSNGQEDMLERVPGLNYLDEYNKSIALDKTGKFNLTKPSEAPFVQKGELFFPITRKPTGKGYKGTKYSDAEYLLEGKLPNEAVLPRYQQKYFPTLKESSNVGVIRPEFNELNR